MMLLQDRSFPKQSGSIQVSGTHSATGRLEVAGVVLGRLAWIARQPATKHHGPTRPRELAALLELDCVSIRAARHDRYGCALPLPGSSSARLSSRRRYRAALHTSKLSPRQIANSRMPELIGF